MKDMKDIENKASKPSPPTSPPTSPPSPSPKGEGRMNGDGGGKVRIKFLPNRAAEGVTVDANGTAMVDEQTAKRLIQMHYAILADKEK